AQVENQAFGSFLRAEFTQVPDEVRCSPFLELRDTQVGNIVVQHLAAYAAHLDDVTDDLDFQRFVTARPADGEHNAGVGFTTHELDGFVQRHALGRLAVDVRDDVARQNSRPKRGRVLDGGDHLGLAVFTADFYTQAAKPTLRDGFHFLESVGVQIRRVRVKVIKHALDGIVDQLFITHWLNITGLDCRKYIGELLQLLQRQRFAALSDSRNANAQKDSADRTDQHQT